MHDLQLVGQILLAAQVPLHFAARRDRQRRLPNQHDGIRIELVLLDDRPANRLHDLVIIAAAILPIELMHDHQPLARPRRRARTRPPATRPDAPPRPIARCPADNDCGRG